MYRVGNNHFAYVLLSKRKSDWPHSRSGQTLGSLAAWEH